MQAQKRATNSIFIKILECEVEIRIGKIWFAVDLLQTIDYIKNTWLPTLLHTQHGATLHVQMSE